MLELLKGLPATLLALFPSAPLTNDQTSPSPKMALDPCFPAIPQFLALLQSQHPRKGCLHSWFSHASSTNLTPTWSLSLCSAEMAWSSPPLPRLFLGLTSCPHTARKEILPPGNPFQFPRHPLSVFGSLPAPSSFLCPPSSKGHSHVRSLHQTQNFTHRK